MDKRYWKDILEEYKNQPFELSIKGLQYYVKAPEIIMYTNPSESKQLVGINYNNGYLVFPTYIDSKSKEIVNEIRSLDELLKCMLEFRVQTVEEIPISKEIYNCLNIYINH